MLPLCEVARRAPEIRTQSRSVTHPAETIAWREKNDVDSYLSRSLGPEKEASVRRNIPIGIVGYDKEVCPKP